MREIKFRAWDNINKRICYFQPGFEWNDEYDLWYLSPADWGKRVSDVPYGENINLMQFTGLKDKNGKEIYEGDIFRVEEDEMMYYLVIVWVQEWCMFCTLRADDEYPAYQMEGIKALDEPMFWTYTLEDCDSRKFFLCGNVYQNTDLLLPN